jgi:hypothetical protein
MHRRELFRLLSAGALMPALSPEALALLRQAQPAAGYTLRTLTPHQNETVVAMTDLLIPDTDTPGAKAARVNEFVDVILTSWATPEERGNFLSGLTDVDIQSNALFGKNFVDASALQQTTLLRSLDDGVPWARDPAHRNGSESAVDRDAHLKGIFFRVFKTMTFHGYYTSEIGFTQDLKLEIIPGAQHGCIPVPAAKKT